MNQQAEIFKPGIAALRELAMKYAGLKIDGVSDEAGYGLVKDARKELGDMRILLTKFGKSKREEALAFQREVIRQEKEHLDIIVPLENELKAKLEAVDEIKKRAERVVLLPNRKKMLAEILEEESDEEILNMDEKQFSEFYTAKKMTYLEAIAQAKKDDDEMRRRDKEMEEAKKEAVQKAIEEERGRADRERQKAEQRIINENARIAREAVEKEAREKEEAEKLEKNRKYKKWLKDKEVDPNDPNVKIERVGNTFTLWLKADEITIN